MSINLLFTALAFLLFTAALTHLPTVQLRTIGPDSTHYISSTQHPSNNGHIIQLAIGTSLSSLAQSPLLLQGFEIVPVEGHQPVFCKANINHSSKGVVVSSDDGMVMLDHEKGGVVAVTGLSCGFGSGSV